MTKARKEAATTSFIEEGGGDDQLEHADEGESHSLGCYCTTRTKIRNDHETTDGQSKCGGGLRRQREWAHVFLGELSYRKHA
jgi:hypothetical protein